MRKIFSFLVTTVDGYYEGPNQEFDWPVVDDEFNEFSERQLDGVDILLFGRVTYQGMAAYWPTRAAQEDDRRIAARMNNLSKIVVSRSLDKAEWANTRLVKGDVAEEINVLKRQPGKDIAILGSSSLTLSLLQLRLVDELRIMVMPVVLGDGRSLFRTSDKRISLKLLKTRYFSSGNVLLTYQPAAR
ncbi:riboflavin biosynthesis protein RibD [Micromonospora globispora]|uniref:Riboflavin biosynthesis protein RibD n=1 Tax=Micromonospora globispora TaxID=1450148 RepID=A0A317K370_9ACTN|nr:dihydrofolate reductase family protein [Micromonospora globispora]PWU47507.1 riboflavin biosynthesis protein RibD [Micromonospora globispora]PWU60433.1 riboflavin biosynthesis protein RibD [Micromonospora globispora]RQW95998.1 riboflavin biosynthesis protein RibD [Micromonospora globispora]